MALVQEVQWVAVLAGLMVKHLQRFQLPLQSRPQVLLIG
jgi:hypothetical protein